MVEASLSRAPGVGLKGAGKLQFPLLENGSTLVPPYPQFHFLQFWLPAVNHGPKILNGEFQK